MQNSKSLFDTLNSYGYQGHLSQDRIATMKIMIDFMMDMGDREHTNDWDPGINLHLKDGTTIESLAGYPYITIGDLNDLEQDDCLLYAQEITKIGIHATEEDEDRLTFIDIHLIDRITLYR